MRIKVYLSNCARLGSLAALGPVLLAGLFPLASLSQVLSPPSQGAARPGPARQQNRLPQENSVSVRCANHTRKTQIPVTVAVFGHPPTEMALLVKTSTPEEKKIVAPTGRGKNRPSDKEPLAQTQWVPFQTNWLVDLGPGDGWRSVGFGFKWATGRRGPYWTFSQVLVDNAPPQVTITNPPTVLVQQPFVQLIGASDEPIQRISYTLTTATGHTQRGEGLMVVEQFNRATFRVTNNIFQCFDLSLSPGTNRISLHCEDRVGNAFETNLVYVLSYANKKPPTLWAIWPEDQAQLAGETVTVRGMSDDASVRVVASISSGEGTVERGGEVERNGKFWLDDLPLGPGANRIEIVAQDAAGNTTRTNLTVFRSPVQLSVNPIAPTAPWIGGSVDVSGRISAPEMAVWVNEVHATVRPDGTWLAQHVPLPGGDPNTFTFFITAVPPDQSPSPAPGPIPQKGKAGQAIVVANYGPEGVQLNCLRPVGGTLRVQLMGTAGKSFILQASTNLTDWISLCTNYNTGPVFNYVDRDAGRYSCRYFRAVPIR